MDLRGVGRGRQFFNTELDARSFRDAVQGEVRELGVSALDLSSHDRVEFLSAKKRLEEFGAGASITEAVSFFIKHNSSVVPTTIQEGIQICLNQKTATGKRPRYISTLRLNLQSFSTEYGSLKCSDIQRRHIDEWLKRDSWSLATRQNKRITINTFFSFALRQKWCSSNPVLETEPFLVDPVPIKILTVQQSRDLMESARSHRLPRDKQPGSMIPYFTLALFGGVRPADLERLQWCDLDLQQGLVNIEGRNSKTRSHRIIELQPNALAWLKLGGDLPAKNRTHKIRAIRLTAGTPWSQDVLRHTFCSMSFPVFGASKTAEWAGHSEQVLFEHYRRRIPPEAAKEFWQIFP